MYTQHQISTRAEQDQTVSESIYMLALACERSAKLPVSHFGFRFRFRHLSDDVPVGRTCTTTQPCDCITRALQQPSDTRSQLILGACIFSIAHANTCRLATKPQLQPTDRGKRLSVQNLPDQLSIHRRPAFASTSALTS
jgi:hypothetical protein